MTGENEAFWISGPNGTEHTGSVDRESPQTTVDSAYPKSGQGPSHDVYGWTEVQAAHEGLTVFPVLDPDMRFVGTVAARSQAEAFEMIPPRHGIDLRDMDHDEVARQIQSVLDILPTIAEEGGEHTYGDQAVDGEGHSLAGQPVPYEAIEQE